MSELARLTWREVTDGARSVLVIPVGSVEQHGPHLPLDTDTRIATAVAAEVAGSVGAILAPALAYGASGEHEGFAGTLSIGQDALEAMIVELVRSADAFRGVVLVNGHGGNGETLRRAVGRLTAESRSVLLAHCGVDGGDAHAGRTETSLLLHLCAEVVHVDEAAAGDTRPWPEIAERVRDEGIRSVSPNGVLGDPTGATSDEGAVLLRTICDRVTRQVQEWADAL